VPPQITVERIYVTPEIATELLGKNINRNMPAIHAEKFCKIILDGDWVEDANPVRIDTDGYVRDGQSRLSGIVAAGKAMHAKGEKPFKAGVFMLIARGLSPDAQLVMDTGRKRTFAHFLQIKGIGDAATVQGITTLLWNWENGVLKTRSLWTARTSVPHMALWHLYEARADEIKQANRTGRTLRRTANINLSVAGVSWIIFSAIDPDDAAEFYAQLRLEREVAPGSGPALLLRLFNSMKPREYDQQEQMAFMIKGWNIFRDGAVRELIMWRPGGRHREPFPEPR